MVTSAPSVKLNGVWKGVSFDWRKARPHRLRCRVFLKSVGMAGSYLQACLAHVGVITSNKHGHLGAELGKSWVVSVSRQIPQLMIHGKASACSSGDQGSIPGSGRSPGEGNGNPLRYSCLENFLDGGAWEATGHGVAKSWTQLSDFTYDSQGKWWSSI